MSHRLPVIALATLLTAVALLATVNVARADRSIPVVNRRLFFSGSPTQPQSLSLSTGPPMGSTNTAANLTSQELEFGYQNSILTNTVSLSSPLSFSLWLNSTNNTTIGLVGALHERLSGGTDLSLTNSTQEITVATGPPTHYTLDFTQPGQSLALYSQMSVGLKVIPIPKVTVPRTNVTLYWGSASYPSYTSLGLSGYEYLSPNTPFQVLDSSQHASSDFDLNSTVPNNIVYFQASVFSAFGFNDIQSVNLTIVDPLSHIVKEQPMSLVSGPNQPQPYIWTAQWVYSPTSTPGTYQANILIVDAQNATAFSFNGVATFGLSRSTILSRALNLIPYFSLGAGGLVVAAVAYRRTKTRKSYLVPFDYFNSLTGGELDGGSVVTVEGNTGSGKTLLTEQLMYEDLKKGRPCVFVSTGDFPSNVRSGMKSMGLDVTGYEQNGQLTFVDGYSSEAGQQSPEKFSIPALGDLTTVGMKISSSLPQESFKGGSLYFDSLTPLASKAKPESLVSFVQSVGARVKGMGGKAFFTLGPSVDTLIQKQLEEMADCVVQMEAFEEGGVRKSRLRVAKLRARRHQQGWIIYTIEEGRGIIFYSKKARS